LNPDVYRLEFFVEPFVEGQPGPHVKAALAVVQDSGLAVEVGPFGSVTAGPIGPILEAVHELLAAAMAAGATRVSIQLEPATAASRQRPIGLRPLHDALARMISAVEAELRGPLAGLPRTAKQAAVRMLDDQGAFLLRGAVEDVADAMGVTRITIYNYLNAMRDGTT
jgi:uncharacterized protein YqgV (UPF0045/DUF77 family)